MKWRNQLLALFCLIVFFAFGVFYFQTWVVQKPFGIILFVADGLDPARLTMARREAIGTETPLTIDSLTYTALLKNYSSESALPDKAAASGKARTNLLELARESGRMTGLVTNGLVTDAAPAGFYAHTSAAENREELARTLVEKAEIDVVLGAGAVDFLPPRKEGRRTDERNLLLELRGRGYELVQNLEELEAVPRWRPAKLFGLFRQVQLAPVSDEAETGPAQPTFSDMVRRSIELLQFNSDGYLLVVNARLNKPARESAAGEAITETAELDRAVAVALEYAGTKSMIIVYGDLIAFGSGLGADALHGTIENKDVFEIIRDNL